MIQTAQQMPFIGRAFGNGPARLHPWAEEPVGFETYKDRLSFRTIWISDTHLGTRGCNAAMLLDFLKSIECETLYLVGDIVQSRCVSISLPDLSKIGGA